MNRLRSTIVLSTLSVFASNLAALANSATYRSCQAASGRIDFRLRACHQAELADQDLTLNASYRSLLHRLPMDRQDKLRVAQRAWLAFRDAECRFRMSAETGGTDAPLVQDGCLISLDTARGKDLAAALTVAAF
jgi:uncharacterized protein YecT (DUF1311 family)